VKLETQWLKDKKSVLLVCVPSLYIHLSCYFSENLCLNCRSCENIDFMPVFITANCCVYVCVYTCICTCVFMHMHVCRIMQICFPGLYPVFSLILVMFVSVCLFPVVNLEA
jgi:hypothetical protein